MSHACCNWPKVGKLDAMGGERRIKSSFFSIFLGNTNSVFFSLRYWCWVSVTYLRMLLCTRTMDGHTFFLEQCSYLLRKGVLAPVPPVWQRRRNTYTSQPEQKRDRMREERGDPNTCIYRAKRSREKVCCKALVLQLYAQKNHKRSL